MIRGTSSASGYSAPDREVDITSSITKSPDNVSEAKKQIRQGGKGIEDRWLELGKSLSSNKNSNKEESSDKNSMPEPKSLRSTSTPIPAPRPLIAAPRSQRSMPTPIPAPRPLIAAPRPDHTLPPENRDRLNNSPTSKTELTSDRADGQSVENLALTSFVVNSNDSAGENSSNLNKISRQETSSSKTDTDSNEIEMVQISSENFNNDPEDKKFYSLTQAFADLMIGCWSGCLPCFRREKKPATLRVVNQS